MKKKSFETKNPRKLKSSGKPKGHAIKRLQSARATWPRCVLRCDRALNLEQNPKRHRQLRKNFLPSMALMTRHWRPQNLGGNWWEWREWHYLDEVYTNDEVIPSDEEISHHWRRKENHSMKPASNLSSYETSKTDRWEPIKSPIIRLEALLRKALTLQRLATKITYIKPLHC